MYHKYTNINYEKTYLYESFPSSRENRLSMSALMRGMLTRRRSLRN